jgi:hypothetical protein
VPHSPSQPTLLSQAVQQLLDRPERPDRRPGQPERPSWPDRRPGRPGDSHPGRPDGTDLRRPVPNRPCQETVPGGGPPAYVLGCQGAAWTVDDIVPVGALFGWRAPPTAWALVVVASGHAAPLTDPPPGDLGTSRAGAVRLAVGAARTGETAARLSGSHVVRDHAPAGGRLLDTLRRSLSLPTPAPPEGTARLLAVLWLASIAAAGLGPSIGWPAAVRLHPAASLLSARGEHLGTRQLEGILTVAPSTWTWEVLRRAEIRTTTVVPLCSAGTAKWMDTGMYARWVLARLPATVMLWRRVEAQLTLVARRRLRAWLDQNDVGLPDGTP